MFYVTHFRTEFIKRSGANIMSKVTMTQFMLVIGLTGLAVGLFKAPLWLAPLFILSGYVAGYSYNGEIMSKRGLAYLLVWGRGLLGLPRVVNVQADWQAMRHQAEQE